MSPLQCSDKRKRQDKHVDTCGTNRCVRPDPSTRVESNQSLKLDGGK